jgi:uncharacterized protein (DUF1501 family)
MLEADISTAEALSRLRVTETDPWAIDRRRFLQLIGMGAGAGLLSSPGASLLDHVLPDRFLLGHDPSAWAAGPIGANDGILVVIGMFGGNDGLNTVVPTGDGLYYDQHGGLAIPAAQTLPLGPGFGLNPGLSTLKNLWDVGQLAVVQGIGYPNADFSHFNSMAYWMSGQVGGIPTSGWLGRWLDGYLGAGRDLYAAAEVGHSVPLHLVGNAQRGTVVPPNRPDFGTQTDPGDVALYQGMRSMQTGAHGAWHAAVSQAFVDQLDLATTLAGHYPEDSALPDDEIVASLEIAARMINANLGFRVLTAGWGDFDSHADQPEMHTARMAELDAAVRRFYEVLDPAWSRRVTIMTFSEFGRTSWDNDGQGTDHGSSAPQFVIGANVKGGWYGAQPSLAGLDRWERMPHSVDFRSYYASIIDGWLGGGSTDVLGGTYENLGLFSLPPGAVPGDDNPPPVVVTPISAFVPVEPFRLVDTRDGTGGVLDRALGPQEWIRVPIAGMRSIPATGATAVVANVTAVGCTEPNYFTVYPGSTARPGTSNLNAGPGRPVPNLVVMGIGSDGCVDVYNSHGAAHCVVDVFGYFSSGGDRFTPVSPARLFDTRTGEGIRPGKLAQSSPVDVQVAGLAGVPASGATAVVINLTVTEPEADGWARVTPAGQAAASTSNVNFSPSLTVPNLTICKLGAGGKITLDTAGHGTHLIGDVFGYFGAQGCRLRTVSPGRLLDTRDGTGAPRRQIGPGEGVRLVVAGRGGVPVGASAVVLNVTATNVGEASHITVWPDGDTEPATSNLNVHGGQTVANLVICRLGASGALRFASPAATCDVLADVLGYFVD